MGNGEDEHAFKRRVSELGLSGFVETPGFIEDRREVLDMLAKFDILMFCHKTKESPRNLIQSLMCGTPIIGYGDAYSRDLISVHGGGRLVPSGDQAALAQVIIHLDEHRSELADLMRRSADDGARFDTVLVFKERSDLVKASVEPPRGLLAG